MSQTLVAIIIRTVLILRCSPAQRPLFPKTTRTREDAIGDMTTPMNDFAFLTDKDTPRPLETGLLLSAHRFKAARQAICRFIEFLGLLGILIPATAYGQVVTASIQGTVQDSTGAPIPSASVKAVNLSTGDSSNTVTGAQGLFIFPSLPIGGPYTITVEAPGFKTEERTGILLAVNQVVDLSIPVQVGSASERVEVSADATQLETSTAARGTVIGNRSIENLPLNQRNVYSLLFLMPGANGTVTDQFNGLNLSVDGGRPGSSDILVDGIPASPPLVNPIQGFSVFPSVDAVQEFKMETDSYSAEFGRSGSGIVNMIIKSGTNEIHGSAYEFLRNSALDSNSYFSNSNDVPLPSFKRSQFGASIGGPVVIPHLYHGKDKTFFFFSYEGLRQGQAAEITTTVPTALQRTGDFSQTLSSSGQQVLIYDPATTVPSGSSYVRQSFLAETGKNAIPAGRIDPVAAKIVQYYPMPNQPGNTAGANNFFASGVTTVNIDTFDAKVDEVFNEGNRMFVRYSRRNLQQPGTFLFPEANRVAEGNAGPYPAASEPQISNSAAIDYTRTPNPNYVMEFRYGFSRTYLNFVAASQGFNPSTNLGFPSYIAANADHLLFPTIAPSSYYTLGDGGQGISKVSAFEGHILGMNNTKIIGRHVLKFGVEGRLLRVNDDESGASTGNYTFTQAITQGANPNVATATAGNAIASLLLGIGTGTYTIQSKNGATESKYYGAYIQDDWRATPRLTLNAGLRYDLDIPRTERYNRMETFNTAIPSPLAAETGLTGLTGGTVFAGVDGNSRRQFQPQWLNFGPRLGLAFQLNNKTVVRSAFGIFFGPSMRAAAGTVGNEGFSASTTYTGSPNGLTPSVYLSNPFPGGLNLPVGSSQGLLTGIGSSFENSITGDNKVGYTEIWNLDVQRQLPGDMLLDVAYVGTHSVNVNKSQENNWNINQLSPQALTLGSALQQSVANPFYGIIKTGPESSQTIPRSYLEASYPQYTTVYASYLVGGFVLYDSIQAKLEKRLSHGLSMLVSYTGAKQIDDSSIISNVGNNTGGIQDIWNPLGESSLSSNDVSRNLTISGVYDLPFGRGQQFGSSWSRPVNAVFGGWQINGITYQQTGFPLSPTTQDTSDSGGNVLRPNLTGISPIVPGSIRSRLKEYLNLAAFSQPAPFTFGNARRTLSNVRAPGNHDIDFSAFKSFQPTEHITLQFRAETFNLLNQVVFGLPNMVLSSGQFGVISSQANTPRQIQAALKILF